MPRARTAQFSGESGPAVLDPPRKQPVRERARPQLAGGPPPDRGDGWGRGGGGNPWGPDGDPNRPERRPRPWSKSEFGFALLLLAIAALFACFVISYASVRRGEPSWPPAGTPAFPPLLWASSLCLLLVSAWLERCARAQREGDRRALRRWVCIAGAGALAFVLAQASVWREWIQAGFGAASNAYLGMFFTLTGLHAAHVLGGLLGLGWLLLGLRTRARPLESLPVRSCRLYWHAMTALWLLVLSLLYW